MTRFEKQLKAVLKKLDAAEDSLLTLYGIAIADGILQPLPSEIKALRNQVTDVLTAARKLDQ